MTKNRIEQIEHEVDVLINEKRAIERAEEEAARKKREKQAEKSKAEINALVAEYNQIEKNQSERLTQLFSMIKARKGYKHVRFSSGENWSNCWTSGDDYDFRLHIQRMTREITEITI